MNGAISLSGNTATLSTASLSVGTHPITATYTNSDGNFTGSNAALSQAADGFALALEAQRASRYSFHENASAYAALEHAGIRPNWIAGTAIGAINAAIIAGNLPHERALRLRQFWRELSRRIAIRRTDDLGQRSNFLLPLTATVELALHSLFMLLRTLVAVWKRLRAHPQARVHTASCSPPRPQAPRRVWALRPAQVRPCCAVALTGGGLLVVEAPHEDLPGDLLPEGAVLAVDRHDQDQARLAAASRENRGLG